MQSRAFFGVDVAKDQVVVACSDGTRATCSIANTRRALGRWLATLPEHACLAVEATGRYHEALVALAVARGLVVYLLNPRVLHHYAKAMVRGNKSDPIDAEVLARYLANEHSRLRPYTPPSKLENQLLTLQRRRAKLVSHRRSVRQSMSDLPDLAAHTRCVVQALTQTITAIETRIQTLIASDPKRADLAQRLRSLPGFGPENSRHQATLLPRIDAPNANACVAYVGLDVRSRDSGTFRGRRRITKHGPAETRRLIYLAARTAVRTNPAWGELYSRYLARGLSSTQATVALARKLLKIAFHLYRHGGTYDNSLFAKNAGLPT